MLENIVNKIKLRKNVLPLFFTSVLSVFGTSGLNCGGKYDLDDIRYCADKDDDGFGDKRCFEGNAPKESYTFSPIGAGIPKGYVNSHSDCEDNNNLINPDAKELCNGIDDNCNGQIDEFAKPILWYKDGDGDGYGSESYVLDCPAPQKYVNNKDDCDDSKVLVHPGAKDICNLIDDDCNGITDDFSGECQTKCGKGNLYCNEGKTLCDAPKPLTEICDGKDNDCNGKIDELAECCMPGTIEQINCSAGKIVEKQRICTSNYKWGEWVNVNSCWTPLYKWTCEKKVIGVVDVNAPYYNFTPKKPTNADIGSSNNQNGIGEWCCPDDKNQEWGVEYHSGHWENFLKKTCSCISHTQGVDDNTNNNPSKNKKESKGIETKEVFWKESFQCPAHVYSQVETNIKVLFQNEGRGQESVWLNWYNYGLPPSERVVLNLGEQYIFSIDERMIPASGTEIELCTSLKGCSEKLRLESGLQNTIYVALHGQNVYAVDERGRNFSFEKTQSGEKCGKETVVNVRFSNHKTLDLQPWINWQQGWPVQNKEIIEPGEEYTFQITKDELVQGINEIALCTSSYGCFPAQFISCGDHKTYTIDWVFGRIQPEKK